MGRDCSAIQKGTTNQKMLIFCYIFVIFLFVGSAPAQDECEGEVVAPACSNTPLKIKGNCQIEIFGWTFQDGTCSEFGGPGCCATKHYFQTEKQCKEECKVPTFCPFCPCCQSKRVGGIDYNLVENSTSVVPEECSNQCVYEKAGYPGSQYCFAPGSLPVECIGPNCPFNHYFTITNNLNNPISGEVSFNPSPFCGNLAYDNIQPGEEYKHCIGRCAVRNVTASTFSLASTGGLTCTPDTEADGSSFQVVGEYSVDPPELISCSVKKN